MMKKILISGLLTFVLVQPIVGMEEDHQGNQVVPYDQEQKDLNTQLLDAATKGDLSLVEQLRNQGALMADVRYENQWKNILKKSYKDNIPLLKILIKSHTSLVKAVKAGDLVGVEQLLKDGVDVNEEGDFGLQFSPLTWACMDGNVPMVKKLLVCKDIQINRMDTKGRTPLHRACQQGHIEVIKLLLAHKDIQVNAFAPNLNIRTPLNAVLMFSKNNNGVEMLKLFLGHKDIQLDAKAKGRPNSLHVACVSGSSEKVILILKSLIKPAISWQQARLIWIGHQQEDCNVASLPLEMIHYIFSFCGDKKNNIQKLRHFICAEANKKKPFDCAKGNVRKELGHILDPKAWQDDQTAEKTYAQLLTLLKEYDVNKTEQLENNGKQEE